MKRIVLDTNVMISAVFWPGHPRTVMELARNGKVVLLTSLETEAEFIRVLAYKRFGLKPAEIAPIVNDIRRFANFIEIRSSISVIEEDATDNVFLACAVDGHADYVISGDYHLLRLGSFEGIRIINAKDFLVAEDWLPA